MTEAKVLTLSMIGLNRSNHLAFQDLMDSWVFDIILEVLFPPLLVRLAHLFIHWVLGYLPVNTKQVRRILLLRASCSLQ